MDILVQILAKADRNVIMADLGFTNYRYPLRGYQKAVQDTLAASIRCWDPACADILFVVK